MNTFCYSKNKNTINEKSLDLYSCPDANDKTPLVVFIHGGAWRTEDKNDYRALATDCLSLGITTVSVNYRLSLLEKDEKVSKIRHPSHIEDVAEAIQFLVTTPPTHTYDPNQLYLVGHSAGAHIAMMLLLDDTFQCHQYIKGVLGVSGIYDIPRLLNQFPSYIDFIRQAFGDTDYGLASPVSKQARSDALVLIAHSQEDSLIDNQQSEVMTEHVKSLGMKVMLDMSLKGDHYDIMKFDKLKSLLQTLCSK